MIFYKTCYDGMGGEEVFRLNIEIKDILSIVPYGIRNSNLFPVDSCIIVMKTGATTLVDGSESKITEQINS
jgi:hypothetical protein